jgi:N-dimethylarginine dimethylaminohydrolase
VADTVEQLDAWDFAVDALPERPREVGVLLADPAYFDVEYVINPHMEGHIGTVDPAVARAQWTALRDVYARLGYEVHVLDGVPGLPDLVFTANQSFPAQLPSGQWVALLSVMHNPQRKGEVPIVKAWYDERGARTLAMRREEREIAFEGMGDAHWFPSRRFVVGGYGFRTDREAYDRIAAVLGCDIATVHLTDPRFYHLDTCLAPLDERTALWVPDAFEPTGRAVLQRIWEHLIEVPMDEASTLLACNGHCPDGKHFIVQDGAVRTMEAVADAGFEVIPLDTGEFLKSGGSVFCMKLMIP